MTDTRLAFCNMRVMTMEFTGHGKKYARMHSAHFGLTSALRSAAIARRDCGPWVWIEGARATIPGKLWRR
jgi:hypothetical protein